MAMAGLLVSFATLSASSLAPSSSSSESINAHYVICDAVNVTVAHLPGIEATLDVELVMAAAAGVRSVVGVNNGTSFLQWAIDWFDAPAAETVDVASVRDFF